MTWTAEQEAKYRELFNSEASLRDERCAMQKDRIPVCAQLMHAIQSAAKVEGTWVLAEYMQTHGAELIALIEPFVERKV